MCGVDVAPELRDTEREHILKVLREEHNPGENERICYLGNGSFGVVQFGGPMRFFVRKRVQYEKTDAPPQWRRALPRAGR